MTADVVPYPSQAAQATDVATRLLELLTSLQAQGRIPQVALTGGTFAKLMYEEVARQAPAFAVAWDRVDFWWGDERFVDPDSEDRNDREARHAFLDQVGATRLHPMPATSSACSVEEGARAYEAQVRASDADRFDLVLLSMGPDGHVASLFPGSPQAAVTDRIAVGVTDSPKPPPQRITLTFEALNRSDRVWLFAAESDAGAAKEAAFKRALSGDPDIPATRVHGVAETIWFAS